MLFIVMQEFADYIIIRRKTIMKKKIIACGLALCLLAGLAAGCGGKDEPTTAAAPNPASGSETTAGVDETAAANGASGSGFSFELKGASVAPGMKQDDLLAALGDADNTFEAPSCAGEGTDYTFTYGSVEISTVPNADGVNEVNTIVLKDDLVSTPEGVSLFMGVTDMTNAYGEGYAANGNAYTYTRGNALLQFIVENDEITSIQYMLAE